MANWVLAFPVFQAMVHGATFWQSSSVSGCEANAAFGALCIDSRLGRWRSYQWESYGFLLGRATWRGHGRCYS